MLIGEASIFRGGRFDWLSPQNRFIKTKICAFIRRAEMAADNPEGIDIY
jgi:hypothetical protein